jgi:HEAT repeat protein
VGPLTLALADKDRRVIASAALALGNMGAAADPAVPALARVLQKGPEDVESSAALALGRIGTPAAKKAFAKHAGSAAMELLRTPAVGR